MSSSKSGTGRAWANGAPRRKASRDYEGLNQGSGMGRKCKGDHSSPRICRVQTGVASERLSLPLSFPILSSPISPSCPSPMSFPT